MKKLDFSLSTLKYLDISWKLSYMGISKTEQIKDWIADRSKNKTRI